MKKDQTKGKCNMHSGFWNFIVIRFFIFIPIVWVIYSLNDIAGSIFTLIGIYYFAASVGREYHIEGLGWKVIIGISIIGKLLRNANLI